MIDVGRHSDHSIEDLSQRGIWGEQTHHADLWNTILTEEHGELAKAILEDNLAEMVSEGVQVATVALKIAWMAYKQLQEKENEQKKRRTNDSNGNGDETP